ncbi:MAG: pyridoxamine 5'-phosphate oxidase [Bernardetiaceae bacterium]|jgi:pyridoxamine 5'-phosphate oxidase|nr:pyridoxamine 5'-phosphate oxidase [Bernardetiaceae bacterium]
MLNLADLRQEYTRQTLSEAEVLPDPLAQFNRWFEEALAAQLPEPSAMNLATVGADGRPSSRIVLLKVVDRGFVFFTNYLSRKGLEMEQRPWAALNFYWAELERQVRIEGPVAPCEPELSEQYFNSRPKLSRIGAIASAQSQPLPHRDELEARMAQLEADYATTEPPRPAHWGGYRVMPRYLEFWQGRRSRLHDRVTYTWQPDNTWALGRLAP